MENFSAQSSQQNYDPRWFVWTIVFLIVTGTSLVSYIILSDPSSTEVQSVLKVQRNIVKR